MLYDILRRPSRAHCVHYIHLVCNVQQYIISSLRPETVNLLYIFISRLFLEFLVFITQIYLHWAYQFFIFIQVKTGSTRRSSLVTFLSNRYVFVMYTLIKFLCNLIFSKLFDNSFKINIQITNTVLTCQVRFYDKLLNFCSFLNSTPTKIVGRTDRMFIAPFKSHV